MPFFESLSLAPDDPIYILPVLFNKDARPQKVNLGIGTYRTTEGKPYLLNTVTDVEKMLSQEVLSKEYLAIEGETTFLQGMTELVLGNNYPKEKVSTFQTVGGTFAIRLAIELLKRANYLDVALSTPTWANHILICKTAGMNILNYPYYNLLKHVLDFEGMCQSLKTLPQNTTVILQTGCHNPTGRDLSKKEWETLLDIFKTQKLFPFFDNAYQGFSESEEKDVFPIRLFWKEELEMMIASSCAKNFGLYSERVGALTLVINDESRLKVISSHLKQIIRSIYSSPPAHGARIVGWILKDPVLKKRWLDELSNMRLRINSMRESFAEGLISKSGNSRYQFLREESGFFSLLGISKEQVMKLKEDKGIYMPENGRINIAGLTPNNLDYVIDALISL